MSKKVKEEVIKYQEHELNAFKVLDEVSSECTLFLKRNNNDFPLSKDVKEVALYGGGVRHTLKGGTGSGSLEYHTFFNIEQAFEQRGIKILTKRWLDKYDEYFAQEHIDFVKRMKAEARAAGQLAAAYSVGGIMPEADYDFSDRIFDKHDVTIYVLSRVAGEGRDRTLKDGDCHLSTTERLAIPWLAAHSKKFLLVINSAMVVDLSPVIDKVDNILLLNFLGSHTSETLVNLVYGDTYPSGKLASSWSRFFNYPSSRSFGKVDDTYYEEGVFVGYRYFSSYNVKPHFAFGFGLSYTTFDIKYYTTLNKGSVVTVKAMVKNTGDFKGKEVAQLYLSKPSNEKIINPKYELVSFVKTKELNPGEQDEVELTFDLSRFTNFDSSKDSYVLLNGIYLLSLGNSSENLSPVASIELKQDVVIKKVTHLEEPSDLEEIPQIPQKPYTKQKDHIVLEEKDFVKKEVTYQPANIKIEKKIKRLTKRQLCKLSLGNIARGMQGNVGFSCESVIGGAGETCLHLPGIKKSLTFADGPAGLRISRDCIRSFGKNYKMSLDPLWEEIFYYLPRFLSIIIDPRLNKYRIGKVYHQYTTSIPVSSAIANSFSKEVASKLGELVGIEMKKFGVDVWLAPAINIIRNPLCGRNFEYYSEDPFLTSELAGSLIHACESNGYGKTCIKHFTCNNQETNRYQSNSVLSIRTLREMYLRPFEWIIEDEKPFSIMTSYNLLNGTHLSESRIMINDVLRNEFEFDGIIMSDWVFTYQYSDSAHKYPSIYAHNEINAGVNLMMPGNKLDVRELRHCLRTGKITKETLMRNGSFVYQKIYEVKGNKH